MKNKNHRMQQDAADEVKWDDSEPVEKQASPDEAKVEESKSERAKKSEDKQESHNEPEKGDPDSELAREEEILHADGEENKFAVLVIHETKEGPVAEKWIMQKTLQWIAFLLGAAFFILICTVIALNVNYQSTKKQLNAEAMLADEYEEVFLKALDEKAILENKNSELAEKVSLLSDTVSQMLTEEEARKLETEKKRTPTGFPVRGTTSIVKGNTEALTQNAEDGSEALIAVFTVGKGTAIVAAADGVVTSIMPDAEYGTQIIIDHENGYQSYYRCKAAAKVMEGSEITGGTMLFEVAEDDSRFAYQISYQEALVNPMSLMEVYG